jgi:hypothetical protein
MIIRSTEAEDWLQFERHDYDRFTEYAVTACLDGEQLTNDEVCIGDIDQFLRDLALFETRRSGKASLSGTDDFSITVEPDGHSGHAWVTFALSKRLRAHSHQSGRLRDGVASIRGSFTVHGEFIAQMLRDFTELFRDDVSRMA